MQRMRIGLEVGVVDYKVAIAHRTYAKTSMYRYQRALRLQSYSYSEYVRQCLEVI
jgi:hypothetical protein